MHSSKSRIKVYGELTLSGLFTLFLVLLTIKPSLLALYPRGRAPVPILEPQYGRLLLAGFVLCSTLILILDIMALVLQRYRKGLLWAGSIAELLSSLYFGYAMTRWDALQDDFLHFLRSGLSTWKIIAKAAVACYILLTILALLDTLFWSAKKPPNESLQ